MYYTCSLTSASLKGGKKQHLSSFDNDILFSPPLFIVPCPVLFVAPPLSLSIDDPGSEEEEEVLIFNNKREKETDTRISFACSDLFECARHTWKSSQKVGRGSPTGHAALNLVRVPPIIRGGGGGMIVFYGRVQEAVIFFSWPSVVFAHLACGTERSRTSRDLRGTRMKPQRPRSITPVLNYSVVVALEGFFFFFIIPI